MDNPDQSILEARSSTTVAGPEQPKKPYDRNWKKWIAIYLAIVVVIYGGVYYFVLSKQNTPFYSVPVTPSPTPTPDPTANWKTYFDKEGGYQYSYPNIWKLNIPCSKIPSPTFCDGPQNWSSIENPDFIKDVPIFIGLKSLEVTYDPIGNCSYETENDWNWKEDKMSFKGIKTLQSNETLNFKGFSYNQKSLLVFSGKYCYLLSSDFNSPEQKKILDHILSTFKFTN